MSSSPLDEQHEQNINHGENSTVKIREKVVVPPKGSAAHRFLLMFLSLLYSGLGQIQAGQKVKGAIFLLAPLAGTTAAIYYHSPSFLYLAFILGLMTGPFVLSLIYYFIVPWNLFISPLFLIGLPVKFISIVDAWFLGKKRKQKPLNRKWIIIFTIFSLIALFMFHFKFRVVYVDKTSSSPLIEPGDTLIVLKRKSITAGTLNTFKSAFNRGSLIAVSTDSKVVFQRIIAFENEKVTISYDGNRHFSINILTDKSYISSKPSVNNDPCVIMTGGGEYLYCHYSYEKIGKIKYNIVFPDDAKMKFPFIGKLSVKVPKNHFFVLPDVRSNAFMSQIINKNQLLTISKDDILGRPLTILWSSHEKEGIRWHRVGKSF